MIYKISYYSYKMEGEIKMHSECETENQSGISYIVWKTQGKENCIKICIK
jgi:hypothetical protein